MNRSKQFNKFIFLRFLGDLLLVPMIMVLAYSLKFKVGWVLQNIFAVNYGAIYSQAQIELYLTGFGYSMIIWLVTFYYTGLYSIYSGVLSEVDEIIDIIKAVTFASVLVMAVTFIFPFMPGSRYVVLYAWFLGSACLSLQRVGLNFIEMGLLKKGIGAKKALIIGGDHFGQDVVEKMILFPFLRLAYVGHLDDKKPDNIHFHLRKKFKLLGEPKSYQHFFSKLKVEVVFITKDISKEPFYNNLILYCEKHNIELNRLSDFASFMAGTLAVKDFDGLPFISHKSLPNYSLELLFKRLFDLVLGIFFLILLMPVLILVGLWIKAVSPEGKALYAQERVGKEGIPFNMLKFRTMVPDAEKDGPQFVDEKNETRYIKGGCFFRKTSIDEWPQLINVIKGEMSLIGPRPERDIFVKQFQKTIPFYELRHKVKGGITGWAQVNGRSVLTRRPEHKVRYDLYYIKNWSFILDIKILIKTFFVILKREEAY